MWINSEQKYEKSEEIECKIEAPILYIANPFDSQNMIQKMIESLGVDQDIARSQEEAIQAIKVRAQQINQKMY